MFESCIKSLSEYAKQRPIDQPRASELARELALRLRQLRWLAEQIVQLEDGLLEAHAKEHGRPPPGTTVVIGFFTSLEEDVGTTPLTAAETLRLLVESFYYSAHRILSILDECHKQLPGLKSVQATGVRRVRNNLIEHANRKGGHSTYSFTVSNASSTRLRSIRLPSEPAGFIDEGFRSNAACLEREMINMLGGDAASTPA